MRFLEYKTTCRAPIRAGTELYSSATSVWVKVSPQSELVGPSSAGFALAPDILRTFETTFTHMGGIGFGFDAQRDRRP